MKDERVLKTKVIGYREQRYHGEPKAHREIHKLINPSSLQEMSKKI